MHKVANMDLLDCKILKVLQQDGRLTNGEVGDIVGLSASVCSRRRSAMEKAGVIKHYSAVLDKKKVGIGITSLISVSLSRHDSKNVDRFKALVKDLPEILDAYALTGEKDYSLKVVSRDLDALSDFINNRLLTNEAVENVHTSIVLDTVKTTSVLPVQSG